LSHNPIPLEAPALAALIEKVFDNLYFRKLYHLLGGGLMATGLTIKIMSVLLGVMTMGI
jgi:hypothetical protein